MAIFLYWSKVEGSRHPSKGGNFNCACKYVITDYSLSRLLTSCVPFGSGGLSIQKEKLKRFGRPCGGIRDAIPLPKGKKRCSLWVASNSKHKAVQCAVCSVQCAVCCSLLVSGVKYVSCSQVLRLRRVVGMHARLDWVRSPHWRRRAPCWSSAAPPNPRGSCSRWRFEDGADLSLEVRCVGVDLQLWT